MNVAGKSGRGALLKGYGGKMLIDSYGGIKKFYRKLAHRVGRRNAKRNIRKAVEAL